MEVLGTMGFSVQDFYSLEAKDLTSLISKRTEKLKLEHRLQYIATMNAIGQCLSDKYTYYDVFDTDNEDNASQKVNKEEFTEEEQDNLLEYFSSW